MRDTQINERLRENEIKVDGISRSLEEVRSGLSDLARNQRAGLDQMERLVRDMDSSNRKALEDREKEMQSVLKDKDKGSESSKRFTINTAMALLGLIGTILATIGRSYVEGLTVPIRGDITRLEAAVSRNGSDISRDMGDVATLRNQAVTSEVDRKDMRLDLGKATELLAKEVSARRSVVSALQQHLTEAERQHTMQDISRNLLREEVMGYITMAFEKLGLPKPPAPAFFPKIGREINTPIPNE